jgi:YjbE family integral membrane protein
MEFFFTARDWAALTQIMIINLLLSGDNAVVIALACRSLPDRQRKLGVMFGTLGAIVLRVVLTIAVMFLLNAKIPWVQLVGAVLLLWIGIKLIVPEDEGHGNISDSDNLIAAVKTIIFADLVMSLDNVLGVAGAAKPADHPMPLIVIGLITSIPIIVLGSALVMKLMDRFPIIITLGGALLGYVAGKMAIDDPVIEGLMTKEDHFLPFVVPIGCAILVVIVGKWLTLRQRSRERPLVDLAVNEAASKPER